MTIYKDSINGFGLFIKNIILFLSISLISAIASFYAIPYLVGSGVTEESINQELVSLGYGMEMFSPSQIIASMVSSTQFLLISTVLLIVAYITKYIIDKRLFDFKRWRDWRFFIYISGTIFLEMYILGNIFFFLSNSFMGSFVLMIMYSFVTVVISAILLPEESK